MEPYILSRLDRSELALSPLILNSSCNNTDDAFRFNSGVSSCLSIGVAVDPSSVAVSENVSAGILAVVEELML